MSAPATIPTPKTNNYLAETHESFRLTAKVNGFAKFARGLERELAEAQAELTEWHKAAETIAETMSKDFPRAAKNQPAAPVAANELVAIAEKEELYAIAEKKNVEADALKGKFWDGYWSAAHNIAHDQKVVLDGSQSCDNASGAAIIAAPSCVPSAPVADGAVLREKLLTLYRNAYDDELTIEECADATLALLHPAPSATKAKEGSS